MWVLDLMLNVAALLLWLKWREAKSLQMELPGVSLALTLKRTTTQSAKPLFLLIIAVILLGRSLIYWQLGSALDWTPRISLGVISFPFRSDFFGRILIFSFLSFGATLAVFYLTLLFFSIVNGRAVDKDPIQRMIRNQLGWIDSLPVFLKIVFPWLAMLILWIPLSWGAIALGIMPPVKSFMHTLQQGAVIGLAVFITWKFVIAALLTLYLLNSYIYFGNSPLWNFIYLSGKRVLRSVGWLPLRIGKIDFAPIILATVIIVLAQVALHGVENFEGLAGLYRRLPL